LDNDECLEEIYYDQYLIEVRKNGIFRFNQDTGEITKLLEGEFHIIFYMRGRYPSNDVFVVMRNDEYYDGTFYEIMKALRPYRHSRLDCFKAIFWHYTDKFEKK